MAWSQLQEVGEHTRGTKSAVAHTWADWLHHPCRLGVPNASERGTKSAMARMRADCLHHPCPLGVPNTLERGTNSAMERFFVFWRKLRIFF